MGAVGKVVAGIGIATLGGITGQPWLIGIGATVALGGIAEALAPQPRAPAGGSRGIGAHISSSIPGEQVIYGRVLVPGYPIMTGRHTEQVSNNPDREFSHIIYEITRRRPLDGIERILIGNALYDLVPNDGAIVEFPDDALIPALGKYRNRIAIWFKPGADDDLPFAYLMEKVPDKWTDAHRLTGICAVYVVFRFDPELWPNGPPEVKFLVRGFLVNDPRAPGDPPTYSDNAALCYADSLYGPHAGEGAIDPSLLDTDALVAAANTCDEELTTKDSSVVARYRVGGFADATQDYDQIQADILSAMAGSCILTGGTYKIHAGAPRSGTASLGDDDLAAGEVSIQPLRDMRSLSNEVVSLYVDLRNQWADNTSPAWPPLTAANPYRDDLDNGVRLRQELRQPFVPYTEQVQRLQKAWFVQHRYQMTVSAYFLPTAALLTEPMDVLDLTLSYYGFSAKQFQIASYDDSLEDGRIKLELVEYNDDIWAWSPEDEQTEAVGDDGTGPLLADDNISTTKNVAVDCSPLDNDPGPGPLSLQAVGAPAVTGATAEISDDDPTIVTYTPATDYVGLDSFTYDAGDGTNTATASINVTIANDTGVTAIDDHFTFLDNKTHNLDVLANDLPDAATKTVTAVTTPSNGGTATIHTGGDSIDYKRAAGFVGTETFDYTVSGGTPTGTDTGTVTVTLRGVGGGDNPSGLPWASGMCDTGDYGSAAGDGDDWADWRGRAIDIVNFRMTRFGTLGDCLDYLIAHDNAWSDAHSRGIRVEQVMPMVPNGEGHAGYANIFEAVAGGAYDAKHILLANKIASYPRIGSTIIRLAHECGSRSQGDAYLHDPSPGYINFRHGWRRIALIYKARIPGVLMSWNNIQRPADPRPAYPGDDCVDIIDADCYGNNNSGFPTTQAEFLAYANHVGRAGEPGGPRAWALYARAQGKLFGMAEWAITHLPEYGAKADNPVYIEGMWNLMNEVAGWGIMEYECYFNGATRHYLHNHPIINPRAAAKYAALWTP